MLSIVAYLSHGPHNRLVYSEIKGDLNYFVEKSHLLCVGCGSCMQELHIGQNMLDYGNPWNKHQDLATGSKGSWIFTFIPKGTIVLSL